MLNFRLWLESDLNNLYQSTIVSFPKTQYRQHSTDTIRVVQMEWIPYLGTKTLYIKGLAQNIIKGTEYHPIIMFKGVKYHSNRDAEELIEIVANDNKPYLLEKLSLTNNDVLVRCNCLDHLYRFNYYNYLDHSLYGRKRKKYEGQGLWKANPLEMPGLCKHLIKLTYALRDSGILLA